MAPLPDRKSKKKRDFNIDMTQFVVEGEECTGDISYQWIEKNEKIQLIEAGIGLNNFERSYQLREL